MLRDIPSSALKQLVRLSERKEALMAQIQGIDREMARVQGKFDVPTRREEQPARVTVSGTRRPPRSGRTQRGALKEKIVRALRSAGKKGSTIRELSNKLKVPSANLYVWFNGTARNVRGIKKIGVAKYRVRL